MPAQVEKYAEMYFTGTQASLFVGDIWIDDCTGIQFHATQSIVPMYGYASSFFDAVARGKVLVQGVFEINFVDEGYLFAMLSEAKQRNDAAIDTPRSRADVIADQLALLQEVTEVRATAQELGRPGETIGPQAISRRDTMGAVLQELANMSVVEADQLASTLVAQRRPSPTRSVIYEMMPFTLTGYFGNPQYFGKQQGTYKELKDCFLVSNEMIIGSNDQIVGERYSFIARMHE